MPSDTLFEIGGLSPVWVLADIYESEAPLVHTGDPARMTLSSLPGREWTGKVAFIAPMLDEATRTVKVRIEFANADGALKPGMYTDVVLERPLGRVLTVPESAVMTTGTRSLVFVAHDGGRLEPREVKTGARVDVVLRDPRGPPAGEQVVTQANFLVDSESRLKAALAGFGPASADRRRRARNTGTEAAMIERIIAFSARNRFVVLSLTGAAIFAGIWSISNIALDALPDLSDTQVIVYSRWDRSPDIIEDQVTYPIITAMLGAPKVKAIRGFSDFGFSYVYVIFEEGTDLYWARSRTLEYLSKIQPRLPEGVRTELGPDATGVGWVFQYALVDEIGKALARGPALDPGLAHPLRPPVRARAWRRWPASAASSRQYQVTVDPNRLLGVPHASHDRSSRRSAPRNNEVGGRLIEWSGARVHGPRARLHPVDLRPGGDRRQDRRERHAGPSAGRGRDRARPRDPAGHRGARRPGRGRRRRSSSCATARTPWTSSAASRSG